MKFRKLLSIRAKYCSYMLLSYKIGHIFPQISQNLFILAQKVVTLAQISILWAQNEYFPESNAIGLVVCCIQCDYIGPFLKGLGTLTI